MSEYQDSSQLSDQSLMLAIARREQSALLALYARYGSAVYGLALRVLAQPGPAEEVTQDIFLKVWNQPGRWDPALGRFSSWLLTSTRNAAIDRLRQERRHWQALDSSARSEDLAGKAALLDDPAWADGQLLNELLQRLPEHQRQLVELAFYKGYTHSDLAAMLDMPLGTVKTRLRSALHALREAWLVATRQPEPRA